jgi:hypothetical protein
MPPWHTRSGSIRMEKKLDDLLEFVKADGRICPNPQEWLTIYDMLPEKKRVGQGWEPAPPLILAAWWETPYLLKDTKAG